jgi:hypothetical protein
MGRRKKWFQVAGFPLYLGKELCNETVLDNPCCVIFHLISYNPEIDAAPIY